MRGCSGGCYNLEAEEEEGESEDEGSDRLIGQGGEVGEEDVGGEFDGGGGAGGEEPGEEEEGAGEEDAKEERQAGEQDSGVQDQQQQGQGVGQPGRGGSHTCDSYFSGMWVLERCIGHLGRWGDGGRREESMCASE